MIRSSRTFRGADALHPATRARPPTPRLRRAARRLPRQRLRIRSSWGPRRVARPGKRKRGTSSRADDRRARGAAPGPGTPGSGAEPAARLLQRNLPIGQSARAVRRAHELVVPVVVVETNIPFVDETITEIVNDLRAPQSPMTECRGQVDTDRSGGRGPGQIRAAVPGAGDRPVPLQVYPRVMQVERLAFDIAARDLAAIITCQRFGALPESLRRYSDVVLRLPPIDAPTFETLFRRVIGVLPPTDWRTAGTEWVKNLLHTDFEHPRRMRLSRRDGVRRLFAPRSRTG